MRRHDVRLHGLAFRTHRNMLPRRQLLNGAFAISVALRASVDRTVTASRLDKAVGCTRTCRIVGRRVRVPSRLLRRMYNHVKSTLLRHFVTLQQIHVYVTGRGPPVTNTKGYRSVIATAFVQWGTVVTLERALFFTLALRRVRRGDVFTVEVCGQAFFACWGSARG